ncbi:MAG: hypothetical protein KC635_11245, partial [Myxococcales bacterium]|nr:hypothetical protein [Myxococcales bacterium]
MNDVHARASRVARRVEATSWGLAALAAAWPLLDAAGAGGLGDLASKSLAARLAVAIAGASL